MYKISIENKLLAELNKQLNEKLSKNKKDLLYLVTEKDKDEEHPQNDSEIDLKNLLNVMKMSYAGKEISLQAISNVQLEKQLEGFIEIKYDEESGPYLRLTNNKVVGNQPHHIIMCHDFDRENNYLVVIKEQERGEDFSRFQFNLYFDGELCYNSEKTIPLLKRHSVFSISQHVRTYFTSQTPGKEQSINFLDEKIKALDNGDSK